jgi:hypothetical protein
VLRREIQMVGIVVRRLRMLVRTMSFLLRLLLVFFVNGGDGVGAFDLVFKLVAVRAGGLLLVLLTADLRSLFGDGLPLHLRALKDRACEGVHLRHNRIRGDGVGLP